MGLRLSTVTAILAKGLVEQNLCLLRLIVYEVFCLYLLTLGLQLKTPIITHASG